MAFDSYEPAGALSPPRDGSAAAVNTDYLAAGALQPDIDVPVPPTPPAPGFAGRNGWSDIGIHCGVGVW